jgi:hypothetical protein
MVEDIGNVVLSNGEDILTPEKAGALFGISAWAMYKRAKNGTAPAHRLGKKIYFFKSELVGLILNSNT